MSLVARHIDPIDSRVPRIQGDIRPDGRAAETDRALGSP